MIKYSHGSFGLSILGRLNGSALFKAVTPALISTIAFVVLWHTTDFEDDQLFQHPYPIGALLSAFTFLLAFRANFSYNRWWEATGAVHQMQSKWLDVGMELAAFHLQSEHYQKPPAFGAHPELTCLVERERERVNVVTMEELEDQIHDEMIRDKKRDRFFRFFLRRKKANGREASVPKSESTPDPNTEHEAVKKLPRPKAITAKPRYTGLDWLRSRLNSKPSQQPKAAILKSTGDEGKNAWDISSPPLFLQEAAHLLSLLSAVAMSTLRNDLEHAGSPLITFVPGAPFPHVDPDEYGADVRKGWGVSPSKATWYYLIGTNRTSTQRTLYNAARPFRVIGGVSDAEVEVLQAARGPLAKVALCTMWLEEFISREYMNGSTGKVAPPIISRLYQFISDGMVGYNQARKVAYIPFPFPHAQLTSLFVAASVFVIPLLMLSYMNNEPFALLLNFMTVLCFSGLHEVARELEAPFMNAPNDIPLNNFQAQFNESLVTMFFGCHPDAYWEVHEKMEEDTPESIEEQQAAVEGTQENIEIDN